MFCKVQIMIFLSRVLKVSPEVGSPSLSSKMNNKAFFIEKKSCLLDDNFYIAYKTWAWGNPDSAGGLGPETDLRLADNQCFGSGLDPDSIRSVDPDSESGSRRAKTTHQNRKKLRIPCFEVLDVLFLAVLRIRIHRIHMFSGLPDPDPLVRGMDPDPSIIMQK